MVFNVAARNLFLLIKWHCRCKLWSWRLVIEFKVLQKVWPSAVMVWCK